MYLQYTFSLDDGNKHMVQQFKGTSSQFRIKGITRYKDKSTETRNNQEIYNQTFL